MKATSIYLDEKHFEFFKKNRTISRSVLIRFLIDKYIEEAER